MNIIIEANAQNHNHIKLATGVQAYNEGLISKQDLNMLYESVINEAFTFFQKREIPN